MVTQGDSQQVSVIVITYIPMAPLACLVSDIYELLNTLWALYMAPRVGHLSGGDVTEYRRVYY